MAQARITSINLGLERLESGRPTHAELVLETEKHSFRKGITSDATVFWVGDCFRVHAFGMGGPGGDFSRRILWDQTKTATQKAIDTQHAAVFTAAKIEELTAQAKAHYEGKQAAA